MYIKIILSAFTINGSSASNPAAPGLPSKRPPLPPPPPPPRALFVVVVILDPEGTPRGVRQGRARDGHQDRQHHRSGSGQLHPIDGTPDGDHALSLKHRGGVCRSCGRRSGFLRGVGRLVGAGVAWGGGVDRRGETHAIKGPLFV